MANLPVKSTSRGIQRSHTRKIQTTHGIKPIKINPHVHKPSIESKYYPTIKQMPKLPTKEQATRALLPARARSVKLRWQQVLKIDDGTNVPIGSVKHPSKLISREEFVGLVENFYFPSRHEDEWEEEYVTDPLKELNDKIISGEMTKEEALVEAKKKAEEASSVVEFDLDDAPVTLTYDDDEQGIIGHYDAIGADGFDYTYHRTDGWRGYYGVEADDNWELLEEDNILSGSNDSENLARYHKAMKKILREHKIRYVTAYARSSNIFSNGFYLYVEKGKANQVKQLSEALEAVYRKEEDYMAEANPLYGSVKESMKKGLSSGDLMNMLGDKVKDPEVKKMLLEAMQSAEKELQKDLKE